MCYSGFCVFPILPNTICKYYTIQNLLSNCLALHEVTSATKVLVVTRLVTRATKVLFIDTYSEMGIP